ncbi:hypothetical protein Ahy_B06g080834 [Arachis hypogaea]|uniref:Aminotransferase-like plant mobile domain-containing protein n=1 Tax=Arachis hypogaea TaxID=3818 RepID=A0A444YJ82_ARAHY|nr:hypothetical protein Ahy_B06g080834 [Arachis hypogaea]
MERLTDKSAWKSNSIMTSTRWDMSMAAAAKWALQVRRPRIEPRRGWHRELDHFHCGAHEMATTMAAATKWYGFLLKAASFQCIILVHACIMGAWGGKVGVDELYNMGDDSGMNVEENPNRLDEVHIAAHLIHKLARVLTPHGTLVDVFTSEPVDPSMDLRRAFVERWRPETHTFHLPWGECTITVEDVAMQLGLPIDGEPVSGTTKYNIRLKWIRSRLQQMPLDAVDDVMIQYACCYILYLLDGVLLPDKANNTVHVRYLPLLANFDAIGTYSWGAHVFVGYIEPCAWQQITPSKSVASIWGRQGLPNPPLNIDTFHRQSARNDDGWWPIRLSTWFEVWASRRTEAYHMHIDRADTLRPSQDYYRWYCDRTRRFLSAPEALHDPRTDDIPPGVPAEYGRAPAVRLPDVPQDCRHRRTRRERHQGVSGMGFEEAEFPE